MAEPETIQPVFIHSRLDDAGLSPSAFRIFCHIARRGECYSKVETIANVCRLAPDTVRAGLKVLTERSFLIRERRDGFTTIYRVAPIEQWNPSHEAPPLVNGGTGIIDKPYSDAVTHPSRETPPHPSGFMGGEGNPCKGKPQKGGIPPLIRGSGTWISYEQELKRWIKEFEKMERPEPYERGSKSFNLYYDKKAKIEARQKMMEAVP